MNTTVKIDSIIKALENIDPASLHGLCDDLVYAGALIPELKGKSIHPKGWNPAKHHTIRSPEDSTIELEEGLCVFEYSRAENWVKKLKNDVESIKQWAQSESQKLVQFIFVTTRDIGETKIDSDNQNKLSPKEFIEKELSQFNVQAFVFGQNEILIPLQNSNYHYIRRQWLNIPQDYFQSLESFESHHNSQAESHHISLPAFVAGCDREKHINALETFTGQMDNRVVLIHAQGGIGKTRFALESLKQVKAQTKSIDILFNQRKKYVNVDEVISEISEERDSLIVLDDAHLIDNLTDFANILLERNRAKIILITRSTAKESVKGAIGYPVVEMELTPLDRKSSIELLKANLEKPLRDEYLKYIAHICEGNPLLIGMTTHLINKDEVESFDALKKNDLIRNYIKTILTELEQSDLADRNQYEPYLALLFLLKPFAVSDDETRLLIRSLVNIDEAQEGFLLRDLEQCAVLERHGDTLWLYPDLLGEYLVETTFFSDIPILKFDDIFPQMPSSNLQSVFKTLRELDSSKAELFLKKWAYDLLNKAESQNCYELYDNLELLEIIVLEVTDEALQIIEFLLRPDSEKPPAKSVDPWSPITREYPDVLWQCLRILEHPCLRYSNFDDALEQVRKIYFYNHESEKYSVLHKKALEAITKTAAYNLNLRDRGWGYSIQRRIFDKVQEWKFEDLETNFIPILGVCGELLGPEMASEYSDRESFGWAFGPVAITDDLIRLRQDVISLLQSIFDRIQGTQQQTEVLKVLNNATSYPRTQCEEDMKTMIRDNCKTLFDFYLTLATRTPPPEVRVLQEIENQAYDFKKWHEEDIEIIDLLLSVLQSNEWYQLYKTLVGGDWLVRRDEGKSYEQAKTERDKKIKEIADTITDENLSEWLEPLNGIAGTVSEKSNQDVSPFSQLLFEIGKAKPHIAQAMIDSSLREDNALKKFVAEFIKGIRESTRSDIASNYVTKWLSSEDQILILEIPETYWRVDEKFLGTEDVEIFGTLLNCRMGDKEQGQKLNWRIMSNIRWVYKQNPAKATEIICQVLKKADQESFTGYINQLCEASKIQEQIDLSQWDLEIFEAILQKFVDILVLSEDAIYILAQYGQKAPLGLVPFFERRVEKQMERDDFFKYDAIPDQLNEIAEIYQAHSQYSEVISQIMEWFHKSDFHYRQAAADLISGISPQLDGPLKQTLLNMIRSGDEQNILNVLEILKKFPEDSVEDLCKEAVKRSKGESEIQKSIEAMIVHRPRVWIGGIHGGVQTFQNLKEKLRSWLEDENPYVRNSAQRVIQNLELRIEGEERRTAEEEIKMKKGLM